MADTPKARPLTDAEFARLTPAQLQQFGFQDKVEGAPADFGGAIFPNPNHIQPKWDTDPVIEPTRLPNGVSFNHGVFHGNAPMDISNPPAAQILPEFGIPAKQVDKPKPSLIKEF